MLNVEDNTTTLDELNGIIKDHRLNKATHYYSTTNDAIDDIVLKLLNNLQNGMFKLSLEAKKTRKRSPKRV